MENKKLSQTSDEKDSVNNAEDKNSVRISESSKDEIAQEVDKSNSSESFTKNAKRSGTNGETSRRSPASNTIKLISDNTSNKSESTIKPESDNVTTVGAEKSKDSGSVATPRNNRKSITSSGKDDKNLTQADPRTKTKESSVERRTSDNKKCTIRCTKGIKDADVKNSDFQGKCILCELENTIKRKKRIIRSEGTRKTASCGPDCGRSYSKERKKKGENVKKHKCAKSLECKKTSPECKTKTRPKRILTIRNVSETCLPPETKRTNKVVCSTCPTGEEDEGNEEDEDEQNDKENTEKGKKSPKKCQKIRNFCRKICSCCRKRTGEEDDNEDKDNKNERIEDEGEKIDEQKGSERKKKRRRKKKYKRFPEGKKPPCAGKSNNMNRFYGKRPACHAGFGMCHPCHPLWSPA